MTTVQTQPYFYQVLGKDGRALRVAEFSAEHPRGVLQIVHGFGEGIEHYDEFASAIAKAGYTVVVHDQRGFGKMVTKKERGIVPSYNVLLDDLQVVSDYLGKRYPELPLFLYGFSMGGNIVLGLVLRSPKTYAKCIVAAPWLANHKPVRSLVRHVVTSLGKISPNLRVRAFLRPTHICSDVPRLLKLRKEGVFHDTISLRLFSQIVSMSQHIMAQAGSLTVPTLVLIAGQDKIICNQTIRHFVYQTPVNVIHHTYDKAYHCLHFEPERHQLVSDVVAFLTGKTAFG